MSYFQPLQGFRDASDQIRQHASGMEQEFNDKKAQTIQEKFDHIEGIMNNAGGGLTGFGAGFHLTRKIYKKVKGAVSKDGEAGAEGAAEGAEGAAAGADAAATAGAAAATTATATGGAAVADATVLGGVGAASRQALIDGATVAGQRAAGLGGDGIADGITGAVGKGLAEAGGVLDFLGPVGELVGAGLAIRSLLRDVFVHKKIEREKERAEGGAGEHPLVSGNVGMSVASAQQAAKETNVVGTLV